ncbi:hypothetical protein ScPMuIL_012328 [Solemya velum]
MDTYKSEERLTTFDDIIDRIGEFGLYQKRLYLLICLPGITTAFAVAIIVFALGEHHHRTIISDFNLVCDDQIKQSHANMAYYGGYAVGSMTFGAIGDIFGRKLALCTSISLFFVSSLVTTWSPTFYAFVIFRFLTGLTCLGYWCVAVTLALELVGSSKRKYVGLVIEFFWCFGEMVTVAAAYIFRDWRDLQLALALPSVFFLTYWCILPESPRWLLLHGRKKEANSIIRKAAKTNGIHELDVFIAENRAEGETGVSYWIPLLKSRVLVVRWCIVALNWFTVSLVYYGLTMNVGKLGGDVFLNFTISVLVEFLGYFSCLCLVDRLGRRVLHCASMLLGGVACLCTIVPVVATDASLLWVTVVLSMVGKMGVSCAFGGIYLYTTELFPTGIRGSILGSVNIAGRLGALIAPYIADIVSI